MRLTNPTTFDESLLAEGIAKSKLQPVIQFDGRQAYSPSILAAVDRLCERFGRALHVRFYGHYFDQNTFDCDVLRFIPHVSSLGIDSLLRASNTRAIGQLAHLDEFRFGVFEGDEHTQILNMPNLSRLKKLTLGDSRKSNIDLGPLIKFQNLDMLILSGQVKNIEVLDRLQSVTRLGLYCVGKKVALQFLSRMSSLRALRILLGGRQNLDAVRIPSLKWLMVDRVRGFERIDLKAFTNLEELKIEDQLQLRKIDLMPLEKTLVRLHLWNCKNLEQLQGLSQMQSLAELRIGRTALDLDELISELPRYVQGVSLYGIGVKRDAQIESRLRAAGYLASSYATDPFSV